MTSFGVRVGANVGDDGTRFVGVKVGVAVGGISGLEVAVEPILLFVLLLLLLLVVLPLRMTVVTIVGADDEALSTIIELKLLPPLIFKNVVSWPAFKGSKNLGRYMVAT